MQSTRTPKKVISTIGMALLVFFCIFIIGSYLISFIISKMPHNISLFLQTNQLAKWIIGDIPLYAIGLPVFLTLLKRIPDGEQIERPHSAFKPTIPAFLLVFICAYGLSQIINFSAQMNLFSIKAIIEQLGDTFRPLGNFFNLFNNGDSGSNSILNYQQFSLKSFPVNYLFVAIVPAFGEEFIFRHTLYRKMRGCGDKTYIILSSLAFGLFHGNFVQFFYATALGFLLSYLYLQTRTLKYSILLHLMFNSISVILLTLLNVFSFRNPNTSLDYFTGEVYFSASSFIVILAMIILVLVSIPLSIYILWKVRKNIVSSLLPATELGWPGFGDAKKVVEKQGFFPVEKFVFDPFEKTYYIVNPNTIQQHGIASYNPDYIFAQQQHQTYQNSGAPYQANTSFIYIQNNMNSQRKILLPPEYAVPYREPINIYNPVKEAQSPSLLNIFYLVMHNPFGIAFTAVAILPILFEIIFN